MLTVNLVNGDFKSYNTLPMNLRQPFSDSFSLDFFFPEIKFLKAPAFLKDFLRKAQPHTK